MKKITGKFHHSFNSHWFITRQTTWAIIALLLLSSGIIPGIKFDATPFASVKGQAASPNQAEPTDTSVNSGTTSSIVINEIHHSPAIKNEHSEFIELFNHSSEAVDLTGWLLDGGIRYLFPANSIIPAGQALIIAQDPNVVAALWGISALGPYEGRLNGDGEAIILREPNSTVADSVEYGLGFPWPTVGDSTNQSINLLHPLLDNGLAGNWRSASLSPGLPNLVLTTNAPPHIEQVAHSPRQPTSDQPVQISALVTDPEGVGAVSLSYQIVEPGAYIELDDPLYATQWTTIPMVADGEAGEGGQRYVTELPATFQLHRRLIRYRIHAVDGLGSLVTVPYADDPQPNFAYFVYDGIPPWQGAIKPKSFGGGVGAINTYDFNAMPPLPVYHLISTDEDFTRALFSSGYEGSDYRWQGTLVYNGEVYDHIRYRARGGTWRYAMGKSMAKFDFNRGRYFQAYDEYGQPYSVKWDKLNLAAIIQQSERLRRGEQGLFESIGYQLFNLAGVEAPKTNYVHFRAIVNASESSSDQYDTDFRGLYMAVEQMDGRFLAEHNLPDGNLYKIERYTGDRNNLGPNAVSNYSDLYSFINAYRSKPPEEWWRANFDVERFQSYRAIVEAIHHYDIHEGKNYFYYLNPETNLWQVHPWDIDQTWSETMVGTGYDELTRYGAIRWPALKTEYHNRFREILDLLFNAEQIGYLLEEKAELINTPTDGFSMVDADRSMWDYNPMMKESKTSLTVDKKAGQGHFYESSPTNDFPGMIELMKEWVASRTLWIYKNILDLEFEIPQTPAIAYIGPPGFPADSLRFAHSGYADPQGDAFAGLEWRIAPIYHPGVVGYAPSVRNRYEIEASWQSGILTELAPEADIPSGTCLPRQTCRVRLRMLDAQGYWSHWSAPVEFVAGSPIMPVTEAIIATEIMYNATNSGPIDGVDLDFIELKNAGDATVDLSLASFTEGIQFTFPQGTVIQPQEFIVLADDVENFERLYGLVPFGNYSNNLNNNGETIRLADAFDRTLLSVTYSDQAPWPFAADNQGNSAVSAYPGGADIDLNDGAKWRASTNLRGSPMADDPTPVIINELLPNPASGGEASIELWNPTDAPAFIGGWLLTDSLEEPNQFKIPPGTIIPATGMWLTESNEWQTDADGLSLKLSPSGGTLYLLSATTAGRLTGYVHEVHYGATDTNSTMGRHLWAGNQERFVAQAQATLGSANGDPLVGPLVISKISYRPIKGEEFVEITNISSAPVPLTDADDPTRDWKIQGIFYHFPRGISIPPGGRILLVPTDPSAACVSSDYSSIIDTTRQDVLNPTAGPIRILGPYASTLGDSGGHLALYRPGWIDEAGQPIYIEVEAINYKNGLPWPPLNNQSEDIMLTRIAAGYSDDPVNWRTEPVVSAAAVAETPVVILCSFDIFQDDEGRVTKAHWTVYDESAVASYNIWRLDNASAAQAVRVNSEPIPAQSVANAQNSGNSTSDIGMISYTLTLPSNPVNNEPETLYWLEAVAPDGESTTVASTSPRVSLFLSYLPVIQ